MDLLLWITIGFIASGFVILVSMKKGMESKLALIEEIDYDEKSITTKSIVWWIVSTSAWGIVSIILIVLSFHNYMK